MNHFPPSIRQQLGSPAQLPATQTSRLAFKRKPLRAWFHGVAVATFAQSLIAGRNFPSTESVGTLDDRNPHSNMSALSPAQPKAETQHLPPVDLSVAEADLPGGTDRARGR
ncbi:hypothetical protein HYQ46_012459 [Verticillium longisporum]|nr:hypothetical protein HYQ46_012459 [Verticillium longisporum]